MSVDQSGQSFPLSALGEAFFENQDFYLAASQGQTDFLQVNKFFISMATQVASVPFAAR
jgi:hypothetical protein